MPANLARAAILHQSAGDCIRNLRREAGRCEIFLLDEKILGQQFRIGFERNYPASILDHIERGCFSQAVAAQRNFGAHYITPLPPLAE